MSNEKFELKSLYELVDRANKLFPNEILYRFNRVKDEEVQVTYNEFYHYVRKATLAMNALGVKDQKVIVMGETTVQWVATYMATVFAGGVIVPLDPGLLPEEIVNFANVAEAKVIVYSKTFESLFNEHGEEIKSAEKFIMNDKSAFTLELDEEYNDSDKYITFKNLMSYGDKLYKEYNESNDENKFDFFDQDTEKMQILLFTSGTTGTSKGVMLNQRNICAVETDIYPVFSVLKVGDLILSVLPVHHTYEMATGMFAPFMFGATIAISDGIKYVTKNIKQYKPTIMTLVPLFASTFYKTIWKNIEKQGKTKKVKFGIKLTKFLRVFGIDIRKKVFKDIHEVFGGKLKYLVVGGAALNPEIVKFFHAIGVQMSQGYGITECAPLISVVPLDKYNPSSCGKPMDGVSVRIEKEREEDDYGEIVVTGKNVMLGYYKRPDLTQEVMTEDGWFRTGDYGYIGKKNYIYITGRKKNIIIAENGKNIFPEEIEEYFESIPLVEEVVVVGRENKDTGDVVIVAVVVPNMEECDKHGFHDDETIYEAINHAVHDLNQKLASYKHIGDVELRKEPFEKTAARKIKRFLVK
ncbi:MAG: AMP-binding protein [Clostridia bacterium]|nr:AMP-binding protein [Clostridia bacterium]